MDHLLTDVEVSSQVISLERIDELMLSEFTDIGRCGIVKWDDGNCLRIAMRNQDIPGMHRIWADRPGIDILCLGHMWRAIDDQTLWLHQGKIIPLVDDSRFATLTDAGEALKTMNQVQTELADWLRSRMTILA